MKYSFKKILLACLVASLSMTAFGCQKEKEPSQADNTPQETISLEEAKQPLTFQFGNENAAGDAEATEGAEPDQAGDTETPATTAAQAVEVIEMTEYVEVTDENGTVQTDAGGQPQTEVVTVTEIVPVTDAAGQPQTDAAGQTQTEVVPVTETQPVTEGEQPATLKPTEAYTPSYDHCKAYWLDMSQEGDFFFEGEFLLLTFEIKKDTPDGNYPVIIQNADIASWDVVQRVPKIINGEVAVNTTPAKQADFPESDFGLKVESVQAKPGDLVDVKINLKNNPGFCGFVIDIQYDKAAMEIVETYGGENFTNTAINYVAR